MLLQTLSKYSRMEERKLLSIAASASKRYKVYEIPKRTGGMRTIEHPSRELKAIQRWLVKAVISQFPVHESATAYRIGSGIRDNAERHRLSRYTNRYDFMNFFPSFHQDQVEAFVSNEGAKLDMGLSPVDIGFIGAIVCRHGRLTIGAPSSPALTNAMMYLFDFEMHDYCVERDLIYTRYADDLFVSAMQADCMNSLENEIQRIKRDIPYISIRLNRQKTAYLSKKFSRRVTGVVITPDHKLSIGRERKREIKALIHRWTNGKLDDLEVSYMRGLLAFARDIEPDFEYRLVRKYGSKEINEILSNPMLQVKPDPDFRFFEQ
jgi:retron-type reverse transcriptase